MDFDEYVAARYGRLIEHAVLLGCAEGEAGTVVDTVLVAQRRRIRRAQDPDPLVREALEREVRGETPHRRRGGPLAAVALVGGLALVGVLATYQPAPAQVSMPSLFGYDGPRATAYLHELGLDVQIERVRGCEPLGQVIGSQPGPGQSVEEGTTVHVRTSLPSDSFCLPDYDDRVAAWRFVGFTLGGSSPDFAPQVTVLRAASREQSDTAAPAPIVLTGPEAESRLRGPWRDVLDDIAHASRTQVNSPSGMAVLDVDALSPPRRFCGRLRPAQVTGRTALRVQIDTTGEGDATCPLTVDLYRDADDLIDAVVVYPAA